MTPSSKSISCICEKDDCTIPFGLCHCGCGRKTKIAGPNQSRKKRGRPYMFIGGHGTRYSLKGIVCVCGNNPCRVPHGKCHCGCGQSTTIAIQSNPKERRYIGEPVMFIIGHQSFRRPIIETAAPFKIEGVYCRLIKITRGQYAIVDATDYEWLMKWRWIALWNRAARRFYAVRTSLREDNLGKRTCIPMHREILGLSQSDSLLGDHINGVTLDNRRKNLRKATGSQNQMNTGRTKANKTGRKGVSYRADRDRYFVRLMVDWRPVFSGCYRTFEEACAARDEAEKKFHGEFSRSEWN